MKFMKMHGCGNDYIYLNGLENQISDASKPALVRALSDRHFGIGGDGVIFINACEEADFEMEMYNADGSRGEMCGNGIRCVAKYVYEKGLTQNTVLDILSSTQKKKVELTVEDGKVTVVRVNMGSPCLKPEEIPVMACEGRDNVVSEAIEVQGRLYRMTCISMGNPHAVLFVEDTETAEVEKIGACLERHPRFPGRTNVEFVQVLDKQTIQMRVWERGTGETLACGTGACASVAACVLNGLTDSLVTVKLLGGQLSVEWDKENNQIYMTGPAAAVFEGELAE